MIEADLIIRADHVLKMDSGLTVVDDGAIAVAAGKVLDVGHAQDIIAEKSLPAPLFQRGVW